MFPIGPNPTTPLPTRRGFLADMAGGGLGMVALGAMLARDGLISPAASLAAQTPVGGVELEVNPLAARVVRMVVALRTADREAEPDARRGADAIHHGINAVLFDVDPVFLVCQRLSVEGRGQALLLRRFG